MTAASEASVDDLLEEAAEAPYHTILEVWREVLRPAIEEMVKPVTPQWANRIVSSYAQVKFSDMEDYKARYFAKVLTLGTILDEEIGTDDECLNYTSAEEDVEHNSMHYLQVIFNWQQQLLLWELDWRTGSFEAAIEIAALNEVHKMFFGEQGLASLLDNIGFQFTDEHREMLAVLLQDTKANAEGR